MDEEDINMLKNLVASDDKEKENEVKNNYPTVREHKYPPLTPVKRERMPEAGIEETRKMTGGGKKDTHTFVKIDGHLSISNDLIDGKRDIKAIAATIALLSRAEKIRTKAIIRLEDELNKLSVKINDIEERMTVEGHTLTGTDYEYMEDISAGEDTEDLSFSDELGDLRQELETLKREINS